MPDTETMTGVLATPCPACSGSGRITWKQGIEQLQYSAPCDDCRGSGWIVHAEIPVVPEAAVREETLRWAEALSAACDDRGTATTNGYLIAVCKRLGIDHLRSFATNLRAEVGG